MELKRIYLKQKTFYSGLILLCLSFFCTYSIATKSPDYFNYIQSYSEANLIINVQEPLWNLITYTASRIIDFNLFLVLLTFVTLSIKYKFLKTYFPKQYLIAFILYLSSYFLLHELIQIRVSLAIALFIISYHLMKKKYLLGGIITFIFSVGTHLSILIVTLFIPIYLLRKSNKFFILFTLSIIFLFIISLSLEYLDFLSLIIESFFNQSLYSGYIYGIFYKTSFSTEIPKNALLMYFYFILAWSFSKTNKNFHGFGFILIGLSIFSFTVFQEDVISNRVSELFLIPVIIAQSNIIKTFLNLDYRFAIIVLFIMVFVNFYIYVPLFNN